MTLQLMNHILSLSRDQFSQSVPNPYTFLQEMRHVTIREDEAMVPLFFGDCLPAYSLEELCELPSSSSRQTTLNHHVLP